MDKRILLGEPIEPDIPQEVLPARDLLIGEVRGLRNDAFQVYIVRKVLDGIREHVEQHPRVESGGILVGHPFRTFDGQITFTVITGFVRQDVVERGVGHFTVGPKDIAVARETLERDYPGLGAVGWYHSHPGHGVFLSQQDMVIVRGLYSAPWQVALVVDPQRRDPQRGLAFFAGSEGMRLEGWLTLREPPLTVQAMAAYNQYVEAREAQDPRKAEDLSERLSQWLDDPQLTHWVERGQYRDLASGARGSDGHTALPESDTQVPDQVGESDMAVEEGPQDEAVPDHLALQLLERYEAGRKSLDQYRERGDADPTLKREWLSHARQYFEWVYERDKGFRDVERLLRLVTEESDRQHRRLRFEQRSAENAVSGRVAGASWAAWALPVVGIYAFLRIASERLLRAEMMRKGEPESFDEETEDEGDAAPPVDPPALSNGEMHKKEP